MHKEQRALLQLYCSMKEIKSVKLGGVDWALSKDEVLLDRAAYLRRINGDSYMKGLIDSFSVTIKKK